MNKCAEINIKELLPDLLHGKLDAATRAQVEAHVAGCEDCTEDLEVLRTVKSAAVFIPAIDVDRVVRQIPPYRAIVPAAQMPARSRVVSWLVAASLVVVVLGGGSLLMIQNRPTTHALALATSVDGLSDNNLRQLMNDMNSFDALPTTEPGPVITVDTGDSLDQGSR